jgi:hypothetical protein
MLIRLTYRSLPRRNFSRQEVVTLVREARDRNLADGITGVLVYDHRSFFQILEGEAGVVDACYARIKNDTRHHQIDLMLRQTIETRAFETWRMGSLVYEAEDDALTENLPRL